MPTTLRRERITLHRRTIRRPPSRHRRLTRVSIRGNGRTHTYALSKRHYEDLIEDMEALSSPTYLASIRQAYADIDAGRVYTSAEVRRMLGLPLARTRTHHR